MTQHLHIAPRGFRLRRVWPISFNARYRLPRKYRLTAGVSIEAGLENDSVPECFEAFDQAMGGSNCVAFVEVIRA
jgi:hypothetical protein